MKKIHPSYSKGVSFYPILLFLLLISATTLILKHELFEKIINIEVATALLAALMSIGCLIHIYQEHQKWVIAEHALSEEIVQQIYSEYAHLPQIKEIADCLHKTLELQSSPEKRLSTLNNLRYNKIEQLAFVHEVQETHAEQDVLETLGLNWHHSSNAREYHLQA